MTALRWQCELIGLPWWSSLNRRARLPRHRAFDRDSVAIDGKDFARQSGMTLKADVILERRRVVEYLFAPLLGIARRS